MAARVRGQHFFVITLLGALCDADISVNGPATQTVSQNEV